MENLFAWDRYIYANNAPINFNDPSGHCPLCLTAVIGGAVGAIVGAVGYTAYSAISGQQFNAGHMLLAAGGGAVAGALIGTGVGWAAGVGAAEATAAAVTVGSVAEGANIACGGDMCAGETRDASQVLNEALPAVQDTLPKIEQAVSNPLNRIANNVAQWVGQGGKLTTIRNKAGDFIMRNEQNTRRFRFDYYKTSPHQNPHMHLEWLNEAGEWVTERIWPYNVAPK